MVIISVLFIILIYNNRGLKIFVIILGIVALSYCLGYYLGYNNYRTKQYTIIIDNPKKVIISEYKDNYIVAPIVNDESIVPIYSLYKLDNDNKLYLTNKKLKLDYEYIYNETKDIYEKRNFDINKLGDLPEPLLREYAKQRSIKINIFTSKSKLISLIKDYERIKDLRE